jgi:hypothetical protein
MDSLLFTEIPKLDLNHIPCTATQLRRARWVLEFCQTDFLKARGEERTKWSEGLREFVWPFSENTKPISAKSIDVTWRSLSRKLRGLREGQPWRENVSVRLVLQRQGNTVKGEAQFNDAGIAWIEDQAMIALAEVAGLLTVCANASCERLFIREKRQAYCSLRCRDTVNKRAYRKRRLAP